MHKAWLSLSVIQACYRRKFHSIRRKLEILTLIKCKNNHEYLLFIFCISLCFPIIWPRKADNFSNFSISRKCQGLSFSTFWSKIVGFAICIFGKVAIDNSSFPMPKFILAYNFRSRSIHFSDFSMKNRFPGSLVNFPRQVMGLSCPLILRKLCVASCNSNNAFKGKTYCCNRKIYVATVRNKNTHLAVFRGYLRNHLSYKKVIYIYLHPCPKSFQMKIYFLKSGLKISWYFQKFKTFFSWI